MKIFVCLFAVIAYASASVVSSGWNNDWPTYGAGWSYGGGYSHTPVKVIKVVAPSHGWSSGWKPTYSSGWSSGSAWPSYSSAWPSSSAGWSSGWPSSSSSSSGWNAWPSKWPSSGWSSNAWPSSAWPSSNQGWW